MIFLRPWFLILLIVPVLFFWMRRSGNLNTPWKKWVDARLLPYLLTPASSRRQKRSFLKLATLIWTLWVLALAGPAWEQTSPAYLNTNSTVFVLDLNSTGRGSELIKVKAKLADLLTRLADEQVALVLYDAKGYVVTPLTQDKNILRALIPTLGADVLPTAQNNPVKGFEAARRLFENLNLKTGRILFITAGGFEAAPVAKWVEQSSDQVAMLFVPTDPSDTPPDLGNIPTERLSADDSDINTLINATPLSDLTAQKTEQSVQTQSDVGFGLVLLSIPFILYLFRKNVLFLLVIGIAGTANANFFWRPDQQAYFTAQQAANAFENKEYQKAYDLFYNPKDADALYNAAGALAYAGKIPEAIALYEQALTLAPTHQDALFNKEYLEKQLPQNNQNAATNADSNKAQNNDPSQTDSAPSNVPSSDEKKSDSPQTGTDADTADTSDEDSKNAETSPAPNDADSPQQTEQQADKAQMQPNTSSQTDGQASADSQAAGDASVDQTPASMAAKEETPHPGTRQTDQETQQLFNRIQEDPARLLRYRLYQQYRRQP